MTPSTPLSRIYPHESSSVREITSVDKKIKTFVLSGIVLCGGFFALFGGVGTVPMQICAGTAILGLIACAIDQTKKFIEDRIFSKPLSVKQADRAFPEYSRRNRVRLPRLDCRVVNSLILEGWKSAALDSLSPEQTAQLPFDDIRSDQLDLIFPIERLGFIRKLITSERTPEKYDRLMRYLIARPISQFVSKMAAISVPNIQILIYKRKFEGEWLILLSKEHVQSLDFSRLTNRQKYLIFCTVPKIDFSLAQERYGWLSVDQKAHLTPAFRDSILGRYQLIELINGDQDINAAVWALFSSVQSPDLLGELLASPKFPRLSTEAYQGFLNRVAPDEWLSHIPIDVIPELDLSGFDQAHIDYFFDSKSARFAKCSSVQVNAWLAKGLKLTPQLLSSDHRKALFRLNNLRFSNGPFPEYLLTKELCSQLDEEQVNFILQTDYLGIFLGYLPTAAIQTLSASQANRVFLPILNWNDERLPRLNSNVLNSLILDGWNSVVLECFSPAQTRQLPFGAITGAQFDMIFPYDLNQQDKVPLLLAKMAAISSRNIYILIHERGMLGNWVRYLHKDQVESLPPSDQMKIYEIMSGV